MHFPATLLLLLLSSSPVINALPTSTASSDASPPKCTINPAGEEVCKSEMIYLGDIFKKPKAVGFRDDDANSEDVNPVETTVQLSASESIPFVDMQSAVSTYSMSAIDGMGVDENDDTSSLEDFKVEDTAASDAAKAECHADPRLHL